MDALSCEHLQYCPSLAGIQSIAKLSVSLLVLFCTTYCFSVIRFRQLQGYQGDGDDDSRKAPLVPYWAPGLFHTCTFLKPTDCFVALTKQFGSQTPLHLKAGFFNFFVFADPEHIKAVFRNSKRMTNKSTVLFLLRRLVDLPSDAVEFYRGDDSGLNLVPRKESTVAPEHRMNFLMSSNVKQYFSAHHLDSFGQRYADILGTCLDGLGIEGQWVSFPDLFNFIQQAATASAIEALCGSHLLKLCPGFANDLLALQANVPGFLRLHSRWYMYSAYQARRRLLQGVKTWHAYALEHCDCQSIGPGDPDWEPYFGSKLLRVRQQYASKMKEMTADARASEDLGLIFASTSNLSTSIFWMLFEVIRDPGLGARLLDEMSICTIQQEQTFDIKKFKEKPLIQSTYAEVLRLYTATVSSRVAEYGDINVAGYAIPRDSFLIMSSRTMALHDQAWQQAGRVLTKPLDEFDAERFLVDPGWTRPKAKVSQHVPSTICPADGSSPRRYTLDGLLGIWIPYGGGDHICPGRHLAKHQIILTLAALLSRFELELVGKNLGEVKPNLKFAPFGALPPNRKVSFRIRERIA